MQVWVAGPFLVKPELQVMSEVLPCAADARLPPVTVGGVAVCKFSNHFTKFAGDCILVSLSIKIRPSPRGTYRCHCRQAQQHSSSRPAWQVMEAGLGVPPPGQLTGAFPRYARRGAVAVPVKAEQSVVYLFVWHLFKIFES